MASSFVPKGQEGLLVRNPISLNGLSHSLEQQNFLSSSSQFYPSGKKKIAYYSRHNPHPERVFHIKGLLDSPICCVEDNISPRMLLSPPSRELLGEPYRPPGNTRYGANKLKSIPAVGIVPVTRTWRDELEAKAKHAIDRMLGKKIHALEPKEMLIPAVTEVDDRKVLEWLCRILQTNSIAVCQEWLSVASEQEKMIVLNMIRMAAEGDVEFTAPAYPLANECWYQYLPKSESDKAQVIKNDISIESDPNNADVQTSYKKQETTTPFKLPEHDTVIRTGSQLGKLASQRSSRARSADISDWSKLLPNSSPTGKQSAAHARSQSAQSQHLSSLLPKVSITKHSRSLQSGTKRLTYTMQCSDQ